MTTTQNTTECPCCGEQVDWLEGVTTPSAAAARAGVTRAQARACRACAPLVTKALRKREPLADGRTRAQAADEFAAGVWAGASETEAVA